MKTYFRKAGRVCGMSKKEHVLVNLEKFEDATPPKQHANVKFLEYNNAKQNS